MYKYQKAMHSLSETHWDRNCVFYSIEAGVLKCTILNLLLTMAMIIIMYEISILEF